jgi:hypothetical protein
VPGAGARISTPAVGLATCARVIAFDMTSDGWRLAKRLGSARWGGGVTCTLCQPLSHSDCEVVHGWDTVSVSLTATCKSHNGVCEGAAVIAIP